MGTPASWKIGMALVWALMLTWFPWGAHLPPSWWGPAPCLGQTAGMMELSPESLAMGPIPGNSFTGSMNIVNNTLTEINSLHYVDINNSFQGFTGISQINQSAGSLNNQANIMGISGSNRGVEVTQLSLSTSRVEKNSLSASSNDYQANITGNSFARGTGVVMVNQAAGHMNAQLNVFNMTVGSKRPHAATGLTDMELGAVKANTPVTQNQSGPNNNTYSTKLEGGAFENFTGIVNTNQVAGNMNQVRTFFNINVTPLP